MSKLVIVLPAGRRATGRAVLLGDDGRVRLPPFPVLATAGSRAAARHGNPTRDVRRPFGHTPAGTYVVAGALPPDVARRSSLLGALVLVPTGGDALDALRAGRTRFLLHGGPADQSGRLRPTFGGLRVSDPDLVALLRAVNDAHAQGDPLSSVEVAETTTPTWLEEAPAPSEPRPSRNPRAALAALGFGRTKRKTPSRRDFVGLALLTLAAVAAACGPTVYDEGEGGGGAGPGGSPNSGDTGDGTGGGPGGKPNSGSGGSPTGIGAGGSPGTGPDGGPGGDDGGGPDGGYDGGVSDGGASDGGNVTDGGGDVGTTGDGVGTTGDGVTSTGDSSSTNSGVTNSGVTNSGVPGDGVTNSGITGVIITGDGVTNTGTTNTGTTGDGVTNTGTTGDGVTNTGTTGDGITNTGTTGDGTTYTGTTGDGTTGDGTYYGTTGDGTTGTGDGTTGTGDGTTGTGDGTTGTGDGTTGTGDGTTGTGDGTTGDGWSKRHPRQKR